MRRPLEQFQYSSGENQTKMLQPRPDTKLSVTGNISKKKKMLYVCFFLIFFCCAVVRNSEDGMMKCAGNINKKNSPDKLDARIKGDKKSKMMRERIVLMYWGFD